MNRELVELSLTEAVQGLEAGEFSAEELAQAYLDRIDAVDPRVQAFLTVSRERALEQARTADERRRQGDLAPLLGVPLAIKDVLSTKGVRTTCGSRILDNYRPPSPRPQ